ncbi:MAG: hypothetical protein EXR75_11535 [Myxococcales bacterium]|nr:hypothetical protein [Myxococcales bacterium]
MNALDALPSRRFALATLLVLTAACGTRSDLNGLFGGGGLDGAGGDGFGGANSSSVGTATVSSSSEGSIVATVSTGSTDPGVTVSSGVGGADVTTSTGAGEAVSVSVASSSVVSSSVATSSVATSSVASSSTGGGPVVVVNCGNSTCANGDICCFDDNNVNNTSCAKPGGCGFQTIQLDCMGEDHCDPGEVCCATYQQFGPGQDGYKGVACKTNCQSQQPGQLALIMCAHDPSVCTNGMTCKASQILPPGFFYCGN